MRRDEIGLAPPLLDGVFVREGAGVADDATGGAVMRGAGVGAGMSVGPPAEVVGDGFAPPVGMGLGSNGAMGVLVGSAGAAGGAVGVAVGMPVALGVAVGVFVGVAVAVGVFVGVAVGGVVGVAVAVGVLVRVGDADGEAVGLCVAVAVGGVVGVGCLPLAGAAPDPSAAGIGANAVERGRWALPLAPDGWMEDAEAPLAVSPFSDVP